MYISTIVAHSKALFKGFSATTSAWPLLFLVIILLLNAFQGIGGGETVLRNERASLEHGGPVLDASQEASVLVGSVLVPDASDALGIQSLSIAEAAVLGPSDPLTNLVPQKGGIRKYLVRSGDTLTSIASRFSVSVDTVRWANPDITSSIHTGQELTILPVSGIAYAVQEDDSLESIGSKFQISVDAVKQYNPDYQKILSAIGSTLVLPGAKPLRGASYASLYGPGLPDLKGYFQMPVVGWNWGELHEHNAVDIANQCGTPVHAAAEGAVIPDDRLGDGTSGWNEGYGMFVLVEHPNGTRTRYAHLSKITTTIGAYVQQGDEIGEIGNTGNTDGPTGCHLHFEVYGAKNPFAVK